MVFNIIFSFIGSIIDYLVFRQIKHNSLTLSSIQKNINPNIIR